MNMNKKIALTAKENTLKTIKKILVNSPISYSKRIDSIFRLTLLRYWIKEHKPHHFFKNREALYEYISQIVGKNTPISYLEFGVFEGSSLLSWINLNLNEHSEFIGFDSFVGLPEDWATTGGVIKRGTFSTDGKLKIIEDIRVNFVKGWFQDTLPLFLEQFSSDKQIIIHCDADIYPSTMYVLCKMDNNIKPGTIVVFDDFSSMLHDFRALEDYTSSFLRKYEVLGAASRFYYEHVAIRFIK